MYVITDERIHDIKALPEFVDDIVKSDSRQIPISKLFVNGAYDNMIFL